ncbi:hypothetical protein O181_033898 [Austropuccinia psidii MF-1]|uniref:Uncharacterized protein n=1 Tax=Austropuccinia psidii MF-1 TaxID=1389203 RepID=A0A9Q3H6V5_9BASI|nr:hypothetical protein [Austropuccinia psidii MF-1]
MPSPLTFGWNPPSGLEDLVALVHSLTPKVDSLTSACAKDLAELANYHSQPHSSVYEKFLQAPHRLAKNGPSLLANGFNYLHWLEAMNTTLFYIFKSNTPIKTFPAFLAGWPCNENCAIGPYLTASLHPYVLSTIGVDALSSNTSTFFNTVQKCFSPGNHFQKLSIVHEFTNTIAGFALNSPKSKIGVMDFFHQHFAQISWLEIGNYKLEGLFIQSVPVVPPGLSQPAFNQLLTAQIFGSGGACCQQNCSHHQGPF